MESHCEPSTPTGASSASRRGREDAEIRQMVWSSSTKQAEPLLYEHTAFNWGTSLMPGHLKQVNTHI